MNRLLALARKELLQVARDRLTMGMMVMIPVIQLLLFGWAIDTDVRHIPILVYDQDRSAESRDLVRRMEVTGYYDPVGRARSYDEVGRAMRSGQARVALVVPPEFGADVDVGRSRTVQLVVDGSDPLTVGSALNTATALVADRSAQMTAERLEALGTSPPPPPIQLEPTIWFNPEQRTAVYIVPGLVGVILTMTMVMLTAMAIARERERGTLEALIVSPVRRIEIVVGKILPYVIIGYVQMTLVLLVGWWLFDVPLGGSLVMLYELASLFILANLAVGLVFSTVARTQQQAMQMSFFFLLPNILLSGFMFPFEGMPKLAQWLAQALPLTHFLRIVRRITLKGAGFFLGGLLLGWVGFRGGLIAMAVGLAGVLAAAVISLPADLGRAKVKVKFSRILAKSREINLLSAARLFLFGSRDIWFVVGLPVFLSASLGWSHAEVGGFLALWVIGYGGVQALAPKLLQRGLTGGTPRGGTAASGSFLLAVLTGLIAIGVGLELSPWLTVVGGLALFGLIFALNSSVHSYLILAYTESDQAALNVGFYYMANAMGRLVGTLLSGVVFQLAGLVGCLWVSAAFVLVAGLISWQLPRGRKMNFA